VAGARLPANSTLARFNGMAPEAKIAMFDFKRPNSDDLYVPEHLYNDYYDEAYSIGGARISSNSWGAPGGKRHCVGSFPSRMIVA